jgi:RNA 2',3'-cyclic 3'-phosphodiesterase
MRLFVGIPLTAVVIEELSAISMRLQSQADGLRWSAPESWHITLQFLGNTQQYECIVSRLRELRLPTLPIQLEGLGFFERAGVFFAGVNLTPRTRGTAATRHWGNRPLRVHPRDSSLPSPHHSGAQQRKRRPRDRRTQE